MNSLAIDTRKRLKTVCLLVVAGTLPISGCSLSRAVEEKFSATADRSAVPASPTYPTVQLVSDQRPAAAAPRVEFARAETRLPDRQAVRGVLHADEATFDEHVLSADVPVLVDFYASWCGPCKRLAPTLDEVAAESPQARVVKVDIDDSPELAARYGVQSVPSLMVFKDGQVVARQKGVVSKSRLKTMLEL